MLCLPGDCAITADRIWRRGTLGMPRPAIDFIFMFTRADETVQDCLAVLGTAVEVGVKHMGFKDIGVSFETLVELNRRIKEAGAASYLELVSANRSEEHTSELQSLMRISYAVLCLKKKN